MANEVGAFYPYLRERVFCVCAREREREREREVHTSSKGKYGITHLPLSRQGRREKRVAGAASKIGAFVTSANESYMRAARDDTRRE
jgi:hypothetical protein